MARPKKRPDPKLIAKAAHKLDAIGEPALAEAVRGTLPELTRIKANPDNPSFTIYTWKTTWEAAKKDAEWYGRAVADEVEAGFTALLAGQWKPTRAPRTRSGGKTELKSTFTTRMPVERLAEVTAYIERHADELGWEPSPRQVAAAWLETKYGPHSRA